MISKLAFREFTSLKKIILTACNIQVTSLLVEREECEIHTTRADQGDSRKKRIIRTKWANNIVTRIIIVLMSQKIIVDFRLD